MKRNPVGENEEQQQQQRKCISGRKVIEEEDKEVYSKQTRWTRRTPSATPLRPGGRRQAEKQRRYRRWRKKRKRREARKLFVQW